MRAFAPGVEVFQVAGSPVLRTPQGEFLAIDGALDAPRTMAAFEQAGYLAAPAGPARSVRVMGEGLIAETLAGLLGRTGGLVLDATGEQVWVCDGLPPRGWAARGLRCSVEGAVAVVEPMGDVTHEHVRQRRLAASECPEHLAAYWDSAQPATVGAVEAAFVAALLVHDLLAWAAGQAQTRRLRLADLTAFTVTDHPILPVPPHHPRRR